MKSLQQLSIFAGIFAALIFNFVSSAAAQENAKQTKPVVLIPGSYHMGNPGLDLNNVKADNVRSEKDKRKSPILSPLSKDSNRRKSSFKLRPTMRNICRIIRNTWSANTRSQRTKLTGSVFRLAKEMNLKQIYGIDRHNDFDFDKVPASAKANNQETITDALAAWGKTMTDEANERMKTATVTEILREMNDEKSVDRIHQFYTTAARVGAGTNYAGADLVADRYRRNRRIYANITRLADHPNERILVLIGVGHLKLLQQFVEESSEYELERLSKYL